MYNKIWFDWKVGNMKKLIQNSTHAQEDALIESTMYNFCYVWTQTKMIFLPKIPQKGQFGILLLFRRSFYQIP